jgi:hypothetical protein
MPDLIAVFGISGSAVSLRSCTPLAKSRQASFLFPLRSFAILQLVLPFSRGQLVRRLPLRRVLGRGQLVRPTHLKQKMMIFL